VVKETCKAATGNNLRFVLEIVCYLVGSSSPFSARNASSREAVEDQDDPLEYAGGEFDEDEAIESVRAARDTKKPAITVRGNRVSVICLTTLSGSLLLYSIDDHCQDFGASPSRNVF